MGDFLGAYCRIASARRGDDALRIFLEEKFDAVMLDLELEGGLDGAHLLKLMKCASPGLPVFIISGRSDLKFQLLMDGADDFFEKPFDISRILSALKKRGILVPRLD